MKHWIILLFLLFSAQTLSAAMLQWDSNPDAVEYHVYYRLQNTEVWLDFPGGVTKETSIDLPPGAFEPLHVYEFTVKAFNECGNSSDYSDSVVFSACEALNIIENLRITVELQLQLAP